MDNEKEIKVRKRNPIKKISLILFLLFISACNSKPMHTISAEKFQEAYEDSKISHSMKSYKLLDEKDGYICLEKLEMSLYNKSKWSKEVICSKIDKLSFEVKN